MKHFNSGKNNPMYGKTFSKKHRKKISITKIADKNPMWKGESVGYISLHEWVINRIPKPEICPMCKEKKKTLDLANKGIYDRNFYNWEWLCRKCHMIKDGRMAKLIERNKTTKRGKNRK